MKRIISLILLAAMLCSCTSGGAGTAEPGENEALVYYVDIAGSEPLGTEIIPLDSGRDTIEQVLEAVAADPATDGFRTGLQSGLEIEGYTSGSGSVAVYLSKQYLEMAGTEKTLATAVIVLSLCRIADVGAVTLYVDGVKQETLLAEDFLLYDQEADQYERQVTVYFTDGDRALLYGDTYTLTASEDVSLARYAVEELIKGPKNGDMVSPVPEGTVIQDIYVEEGVCYLDLSPEFYENIPDTAAAERVTIYAVVNTLTSLSSISAVQFTVDGEKRDLYLYLPLDEPISRNTNAIGGTAAGGECISIYLLSETQGKLAGIPVFMETEGEGGLPARIMEIVIDGMEELGYSNAVSRNTEVRSLTVRGGICYLDLSRDFQSGESAEVSLAVAAIVAALTELPEINGVKVTAEGQDIMAGGENLSEVLHRDDRIILE